MTIINTVIKGKQPSGTITITSNTTTNVSDYEYAVTEVPTTAPAHYIEFGEINTQTGKGIYKPFVPVNLNGITTLQPKVFYGLFYGATIGSGDNTSFMSVITTIGEKSCYMMFGSVSGYDWTCDLSGVTSIGTSGCEYMFDTAGLLRNVNLSSLATLSSDFSCRYMFRNCSGLTSFNLSSLTTISGSSACYNMFAGCNGLTSVSFPSLTTISGSSACYNMFFNCAYITSADFSALTTVGSQSACYGMFQSCTRLTSIDLSSLTTINGASAMNTCFYQCKSLTSIDLFSLTEIKGNSAMSNFVRGASGITNISFYSLTANSFTGNTNQFDNLVLGTSGCVLHFPSNLDPNNGSTVISSLTGYPTFGGTNTTLLFDLPATVILTGADTVIYTRNPKYDTATALAWKVGAYGTTNFTPAYYTSGTTDPQANDTIYSDSACTTAVTTISSIA